ncbi:hypothetical protein N2152v2_007408 [Parachlorella kessleri]
MDVAPLHCCKEGNAGAAPHQRQRNLDSASGRVGRYGEGGARSAPRQQRQRQSDSANDRRKPAAPGAPAELPVEIPVVRTGQGSSSTFFTSEQFKEIGASEEVVQALASIGIKRPSHVQAAAYRALLSPARHVILADHAGSGKTLAYLLPLIQQLKEEEAQLGRRVTQPGSPRIVVVVPTAELCSQVVRVCRALSRALPFRSLAATGGHKLRTQREALEAGVDVLVATPGRLQELLAPPAEQEGSGAVAGPALRLGACRAVVLDEVDVLLGDASAFAEQVRPLQAAAPPSTRFVFVTATIPDHVFADLELGFPGIVAAFGPGLHRTAPGVVEQLVDCSGGDEVSEESGTRRKAAALLAVLQEQKAARAIVFCNKIETCRKVENFLNRTFGKEDGARVLAYHAAIAPEGREANLKTFLAAPASSGSGKSQPQQGVQQQAQRLVLVCTDRASRGVDSAYVDHVVLFDFPRDPSEYVRRVGRTARGAGGQGVVSILVLGRQVKLAQDIINRNQKGLPVHRVPLGLPLAGAVATGAGAEEEGEDVARWRKAQQQMGEDGADSDEFAEG